MMRQDGAPTTSQLVALAVVAGLVLLGGVISAVARSRRPGSAPRPEASLGKIVFVSDRDGSQQIYVMSSDGSGQTRLTHDTSNDSYPSWSPDGSRTVFSSDRDGHRQTTSWPPTGPTRCA